ncbi:hypothetical protein [Halomonas sp. 707B3]|uniref:hypothetical protein n=1 Tax=Halomonas sp. 707B3 TaxID=1681043 RepID=UPI00209FE120|nr:hypothetical protein [Halomonas sp. 707B3]MCP1319451.1 hypothetical protein [Halomonas sp. 707B3]
MITNPLDNPSATIIRSLIQQQYTLSVYSQDLPQVLQAEVVELNSSTGRMILEIEYIGENIERFSIKVA